MSQKSKVIRQPKSRSKPKQKTSILTDRGQEELNSIKSFFKKIVGKSNKPKKKTVANRPNKQQRQLSLDKVPPKPLTGASQDKPEPVVQKGIKKPVKNTRPKSRIEKEIQLAEAEHEQSKQSEQGTPKPPKLQNAFRYTKPVIYDRKREQRKEVEVVEIKDEKVVKRSVVLESVKDINEISFFERIGLVSYFNALQSGKFDERAAREEYKRNTEILQRENSLKYMLMEIGERNLNFAEFQEVTVLVDPNLKDELNKCIHSRLLTSYEFEIIERNPILVDMNVDPIVVKMRLKVIM